MSAAVTVFGREYHGPLKQNHLCLKAFLAIQSRQSVWPGDILHGLGVAWLIACKHSVSLPRSALLQRTCLALATLS